MGIIPDDEFLVQPNKAQEAPQAPQSVGPIKKNTIADDDFLAVPKDAMPGMGTAALYGAGRNIIPSLGGLLAGTVGGVGGGLVGGPAAAYTAPAAAFAASTGTAYLLAEGQNAVWKPGLREQLAASKNPNTYTWMGLAPGFVTGKFIDPKALATGGLKAGANAAEIAAANAVKRAARIELATEVGGELGGDVVINALTGQEQNLGQSLGMALTEGLLQGQQTRVGRAISQSPINLAQYLTTPSAPKPATPVTPGIQSDILAEARGAVDIPAVNPNAPIPLGPDGLPVATQGQIAGQNVPAVTTSTPAVATPAVATPAVATPAVATPATATPAAAAAAAPAAPVARPSVEPGTAPAVAVGADGRGQVSFVPNHIPAHENLAPEQLRAAHAAMEPAQAANSIIALNAEAHRRNGNIKPSDPAFTERILTHTGVALRDLAAKDQGLAISTGEGLSRLIESQITKAKNNPEQSPYTPEQVFEMEYRKGRVDAIVEHLRKGGTEPLPYSVAGVTEYVKNMKYYAGKDAEVEAARNTPPSPEQAAAEAGVDIGEVAVNYDTKRWQADPKMPNGGSVVQDKGQAPIVEYNGRLMVLRNVNGVQVPFYLSTGDGGKKDVPSGKWYPFFGVADGWLNKTGGKEMASYYGRADLAAVARQLDRTIGDIRHQAGRDRFPKVGNKDSFAHINQGLTPTGNGTPETRPKLEANMKNLFDRLDAAAAQRKPKPVAAQPDNPETGRPQNPGDHEKKLKDAGYTKFEDGYMNPEGDYKIVIKGDKATAVSLDDTYDMQGKPMHKAGETISYVGGAHSLAEIDSLISALSGKKRDATWVSKNDGRSHQTTDKHGLIIAQGDNFMIQRAAAIKKDGSIQSYETLGFTKTLEEAKQLFNDKQRAKSKEKALERRQQEAARQRKQQEAKPAPKPATPASAELTPEAAKPAPKPAEPKPSKPAKPLTKKEQRAAEKKSKEEKEITASTERHMKWWQGENPNAGKDVVDAYRMIMEREHGEPASDELKAAYKKVDDYEILNNENAKKVVSHPGVERYERTTFDEDGVVESGSVIHLKEGYTLDVGPDSGYQYQSFNRDDDGNFEGNSFHVNNDADAAWHLDTIVKKSDLPEITARRKVERAEEELNSWKNAMASVRAKVEKLRSSKKKEDIDFVTRAEAGRSNAEAELKDREQEALDAKSDYESKFGKYEKKVQEPEPEGRDPAEEEPDPDEDPEDVAEREAAFAESDAENDKAQYQRNLAKSDQEIYQEKLAEAKAGWKRGSEKTISQLEKKIKSAEEQIVKIENGDGAKKKSVQKQLEKLKKSLKRDKRDLEYSTNPDYKSDADLQFEAFTAKGYTPVRAPAGSSNAGSFDVISQMTFLSPDKKHSIGYSAGPDDGFYYVHRVKSIDENGHIKSKRASEDQYFKTMEEAMDFVASDSKGPAQSKNKPALVKKMKDAIAERMKEPGKSIERAAHETAYDSRYVPFDFDDPKGHSAALYAIKEAAGLPEDHLFPLYGRWETMDEFNNEVDTRHWKPSEPIEDETPSTELSDEELAREYRESAHGGAETIPVDRKLPKSMDLDFGLGNGDYPNDAYYYRELLNRNLGLNYSADKKKKIQEEYDRVDAIIKAKEAEKPSKPQQLGGGVQKGELFDSSEDFSLAGETAAPPPVERTEDTTGDFSTGAEPAHIVAARDQLSKLEKAGRNPDQQEALRKTIAEYNESVKPKEGDAEPARLRNFPNEDAIVHEEFRDYDVVGISTPADGSEEIFKLKKIGVKGARYASPSRIFVDPVKAGFGKEKGVKKKSEPQPSFDPASFRERVENDEVAKGILDHDSVLKGRGKTNMLRPTAEIAEEMNVGIKNVSRLMQQLVREKLVEAFKGSKVNTANGSYTTTYKLADGVDYKTLKARLMEIAGGEASAEAPRTDLKGVKGFQRGIQDMRDLLADSQNDKVRELRQANVDKMEALLAATKDKPTDNGRLETQRRKLRELLNGNTFRPGRSSGLDFAEMPRVRDIMDRIASYEKLGKTSAATAESVLTPVSDNEPASITEARQQLSSIIKNMSRGEGWDAKRRDAEAKIEQFEVENKLLSGKYEPTAEDMEIISNAALEEFVAKFGSEDVDPAITAAVEAELAARFETQEKSGIEDTDAGDTPSQKGDLLADIRNLIAEHGNKYGIPTLPAEFGADSLNTLREQLSEGQVIALMRNPVGMGKVDANRAKTDATYRKDMKDRAEGQLSDLATALSELGWTQFDPANFNTDDLVQAIVAAGRGEMLTPKGGVLGAAAPVDMKASGIIERLYEADQANPDDPFSRRDDARDNAPKKLFSYPNTKKFNEWTKGNQYGFKPRSTMLKLVRGVEKLRDFNGLVDGFVTTVFHGTKSEGREFDQFKPGSLTYFVADRDAAGMYAKDAPDMYYVRSSLPAVLTSPNAAIQAFESSGTSTKQGRIGKDLIDFYNDVASESFDSLDSFVSALEDGRLFDIDGRSQAGIQHQMSRWFLESASVKYNSVVFNDSTVSTESPTIVVSNDGHPKLGGDKPNTSVKAASNFGGFSSEDPRFNFSRRDLSPDAAKRELERRQAQNAKNRAGDPESRKGYSGIVSRVTDEMRLRGDLTPKEIEGVTRIMNKIGAQFFEGVKMKVGAGSRPGEYGQYQTVERIITIFKDAIRNGKFEETAAHEIAHHIARFLPEADRQAVIAELHSKRAEFLKRNKGLENLFSATDRKDWAKKRFTAQQIANANLQDPTSQIVKLDADELKKEGYKPNESIYRLKLTDETYRLTNPNEYFAEEFKDNVMRELNSDPVYLGRSRNWKEKLAGLWQDIKLNFRKMFGKEIANKILSNFAKGRYNPDEEGSADITGIGSDRQWGGGTTFNRKDRELKAKRIVKGPDNDANSLYPIGEQFVRPEEDGTTVANILGRNKMTKERARQIEEFVKDSIVKHALYRGQNNAYETLDANSSTDGLFHIAADPDYAVQYAQDFNKKLPKVGTSGAVAQVYINVKNVVDISDIGHSIDSRAKIQEMRKLDNDGLSANEHIAAREDEFINKIISEVQRINEGKDIDLTELREGLIEAFDEARDDHLNKFQTSIWQVFSHQSIHSLFNKYGVDAIKYSDSDLRTAQGGKKGGQESYVLADPRRIKAAFGGNDVNTSSSNIFQSKGEPKQSELDMRVSGEVRLQDAMGVANKNKLTEAEFERLASQDPSFNQREWQSVMEEGHFTNKGPDARLKGARVYKRIALPGMADPSAEVTAQNSLPKGDVSNSGNGQVFKSVRDASTDQSEDPEVFKNPRSGESVTRSAWDIVSGRFFSGMSGKAHQNAKRHPYSDAVKAIANMIHSRPGTKSNAYERDLPTAISTARSKYHTRLNKIMEPLRGMLGGFKDTDQGTAKQQREEVYQALNDMITGRKNITSGAIGESAAGLKALLAEIHDYRTAAGESIGTVADYYPAVYDSPRIGDNRKDFIKDAKKAYEIQLGEMDPDTLRRELGLTKKEYEEMADNDPDKLEEIMDELTEQKALGLYNSHVRGAGAEEFDSIFGMANKSGAENPSMKRKFSRASQDIMRKWQVNDPFRVVGRYITSGVKRAEIVRRFGNEGEKWKKLSTQMEKDGVPYEVISEMRELTRGAAGIGIPPRGKAGQTFVDTVTLATAASAMGRGFLNNLVEPVTIGMRTGNPIDILRAYAETWTRFLRELPGLSPTLRAKMGETFWSQYGHEIGTIHNSIEDAWMTTHSMELDAEYADPRFRWLTNRVYKANLMDATETAKQQASHAIGFSYINRLAAMARGDHWTAKLGMNAKQSVADQLSELGIAPEKQAEFADWSKKLQDAKDSEAMALMLGQDEMARLHQEAMVRFSMQSSVRSNRAHKPEFQDNPLGKAFLQLMNFSYSYAAEVNSRMYDMAKQSLAFSPEGKNYTAYDRIRMMGPVAGGLLSILAYRGLLELKDLLYPSESSKQRAKDPEVVKWVNATSYAGLLGPKFEQMVKSIKRDQAVGGPVGQMAVNVGRAGKSVLESAAEGKDMSAAKKSIAKASVPLLKGGIVAGASAINPALGTVATQATNAPAFTNAIVPQDGKKSGGLTPDVFRLK
jgi:hypothetical protein